MSRSIFVICYKSDKKPSTRFFGYTKPEIEQCKISDYEEIIEYIPKPKSKTKGR